MATIVAASKHGRTYKGTEGKYQQNKCTHDLHDNELGSRKMRRLT